MTVDDRQSPFFVVFSLSRCGSTALFRALNAHSEIRCVFEPVFHSWDDHQVSIKLNELHACWSGMKHVWDPSGFPFVPTHKSDIPQLTRDYPAVARLNKLVLRQGTQQVIFLRRRNQLERIISDLLGQQTELWGPASPDGRLASGLDEAAQYRASIKSRSIRPLDLEVVDWYLRHVPQMEEDFRDSIAETSCLDLYYEDFLGPQVGEDERIRLYSRILHFLGYSSEPSHWDRSVVESVFRMKGKLNDGSTLDLIPNINEVYARFGTPPTS